MGAAFSGGSSTFFVPINPALHDEVMLDDLRFKYRHPTDRQMLNCKSLPEAFVDLCSFLRTAKGRMDGVVLLFLYRETLLTFLKTVGKLEDNIRQQVTLTVKGYVVLESLIRANILTNVEARLNIRDVRNLFNIKDPSESSDHVAEILLKTACSPEVKKYLGNNMKKLRVVQVDEVANVVEKLFKVNPLISYIAVNLAKSNNLSLKGIFDPFPQNCLPDSPEFISNKFVELLVFNDLSMDKLKDYEQRYGSDKLYGWLKSVIFESIGDQREKTVKIVEDCLTDTVYWTHLCNESP